MVKDFNGPWLYVFLPSLKRAKGAESCSVLFTEQTITWFS